MTDEKIIQYIKAGASKRMKAIRSLYEREDLRNMIKAYVCSNSGTTDDAKDVFHDGIIVFDRNVRNDQFRGESQLEVYLYSICKYTWLNKVRKRRKIIHSFEGGSIEQEEPHSPDIGLHTEELNDHLDRLLEKVSVQCRKIFSMWKLDYSMEEIAKALDLSSPRMARKYKYRCMKRLIQFLEEQPAFRQTIETLLYG